MASLTVCDAEPGEQRGSGHPDQPPSTRKAASARATDSGVLLSAPQGSPSERGSRVEAATFLSRLNTKMLRTSVSGADLVWSRAWLCGVDGDGDAGMATFGVARSIHADVDALEQFLVREHSGLLRAAFLLTGDQVSAQDLAQETAVRVVVQWRKIARAENPQAYSRKVMLHAFLGGRRRAWTREVPHDVPPDHPFAGTSAYDAVDELEGLRRALMALPPRQRAAVVLRHWEDRSEAETAQLMGCSVGNVKALTSRGLAQLRNDLSATTGGRSNEGNATR